MLDEMGADKPLGKGDMPFLQPGTSLLMRFETKGLLACLPALFQGTWRGNQRKV
jgi:hypothetical protein